jgi:hypothetical protein
MSAKYVRMPNESERLTMAQDPDAAAAQIRDLLFDIAREAARQVGGQDKPWIQA